MKSSIRDNHKNGAVGDFLKSAIADDSKLSIVSAYFTIYAYNSLKDKLNSIDDFRFLFGEPTFIKALDPEKKNHRKFKIEDDTLTIPLEARLQQKSVARECYAWLKDKAEIKSMVKPNFLHGKMYHIEQPGGVEKAIVGSSNFTVNGLGIGGNKNIELNMIIDSDRDRQDLKKWFDDLWNDKTGLVEDVKEDVLKYITQLYAENEPEFIYFKTLFHLFQSYLDDQKKGGLLNEKTGFFESEIWDVLYDFQKDGVKGAINKILKHNGCIIADSVGLGKTYEALAVIKYFELLNQRVLVICPKKLSGNWTIYQAGQNHALNPFVRDRFNYSVLYHTDMGRSSGISGANGIRLDDFNWGAYDLIVIDESHNFRGNPLERTNDDGTVKMNRAKWLMDKIIKAGVKTRVLMLSATPVNNTLKDLRNQIALITEGENNALQSTAGIKNIASTLEIAQKRFTNWADPKKNPSRNLKQLLEKLDSGFFKLLDELTIARSRKHIKSFYKIKNIDFPGRFKPISVYPVIDRENKFPTYDELNKEISKYKLSVFNPSSYIKDDMQEDYKKKAMTSGVSAFTQSDREYFLIGMMKVNYLKRLESSIESFEISIERTIKKIEALEKKINNFLKNKTNKNEAIIEFSEPTEVEENEDESDELQVGKKLKFKLADLELEKWLAALKKDKSALTSLYDSAKLVTPDRDAKIHELKKLIRKKTKKPINNKNKKVVIFTAFADTAEYLYEHISKWVQSELKLNSALICGSHTETTFGKKDYDSILTNFSPISKNRSKLMTSPQEGEIDILIATDCISEGQNLQDCDYLVNYDIHWNPVRIIQRFGRIDRLGSINKTVQLVNFWPTHDLDSYLNLKQRVEARMALVDVTATADDNLLTTDQIEELISDELKYRNKQLKKLRDEVIDIEEMEESISLTDFTLDDFRVELLSYIENNKQKLENAPLGLYAIVPSPSGKYAKLNNNHDFTATEKEIIKPGIIYCLRQKGDTHGSEEVNPLQPYFLVYIREDGTLRYNYVNAKQILEIFRLLCQGKNNPYEKLCELFNKETGNGEQMDKYAALLKKAVMEIAHVFKKRSAHRLTNNRSALVIPKKNQVKNMESFELITWLVIK